MFLKGCLFLSLLILLQIKALALQKRNASTSNLAVFNSKFSFNHRTVLLMYQDPGSNQLKVKNLVGSEETLFRIFPKSMIESSYFDPISDADSVLVDSNDSLVAQYRHSTWFSMRSGFELYDASNQRKAFISQRMTPFGKVFKGYARNKERLFVKVVMDRYWRRISVQINQQTVAQVYLSTFDAFKSESQNPSFLMSIEPGMDAAFASLLLFGIYDKFLKVSL